MKRSYIRPYTPEDRDTVLNLRLQQADLDEMVAAHGVEPKYIIAMSLDISELLWVIIHDDNIEGVFGLAGKDEVGVPWLLMTDKSKEFRYAFLTQSWDVIEVMLGRYSILSNVVDTRHTQAVRWLKWLGFSFVENDIIMHDDDVIFKLFYMHREGRP
jgi:hypothetical protein